MTDSLMSTVVWRRLSASKTTTTASVQNRLSLLRVAKSICQILIAQRILYPVNQVTKTFLNLHIGNFISSAFSHSLELDSRNCPTGRNCVHKKSVVLPGCDNICPKVCSSHDELSCLMADPITGCYTDSVCLPKMDIKGCANVCPFECSKGLEECKLYSSDGCITSRTCFDPDEDSCVSPFMEDGCPSITDSKCSPEEILCPRRLDFRGCLTSAICASSHDLCN